MLDILLAAPGIDTAHVDRNGNTMLLFAAAQGARFYYLQRLMSPRVSMYDTNNAGDTALHLCMAADTPCFAENIAFFVRHGGDLVTLTRNNAGQLPGDMARPSKYHAWEDVVQLIRKHEALARADLHHVLQSHLPPPLAAMVVACL
jgi:hypothetical protein